MQWSQAPMGQSTTTHIRHVVADVQDVGTSRAGPRQSASSAMSTTWSTAPVLLVRTPRDTIVMPRLS